MFLRLSLFLAILAGAALASFRDHTVTILASNRRLDVDISSCYPILPKAWDGYVVNLDRKGNCVHLYENQYCSGPFFIRGPGIKDDSLGYTNWGTRTSSLGPCLDRCHPQYLTLNKNKTGGVFINFSWWNNNFVVTERKSILVLPNTCLNISDPSWGHSVFGAIYDHHNYCVEVYENSDCTGERRRLNGGTTSHGLPIDTFFPLARETTGSIAFCGYGCDKLNRQKINIFDQEVDRDLVVLYNEEDFYGNRHAINASDCVILPDEWKYLNTKSINPYGNCVNLFRDGDCRNRIFEGLGAHPNIKFEMLNSIQVCDSHTRASLPCNQGNEEDYDDFPTCNPPNDEETWPKFGCYKGTCWANCKGIWHFSESPEWCYTTKGARGGRGFVRCENDDDCCQNWNCGGACTL